MLEYIASSKLFSYTIKLIFGILNPDWMTKTARANKAVLLRVQHLYSTTMFISAFCKICELNTERKSVFAADVHTWPERILRSKSRK